MDLSTLDMPRFISLAGVLALSGPVACGGDDEPPASGDTAAQTHGESSAGDMGGGSRDVGGSTPNGPALTGNVAEARQGVESVDEVYEGFDAAVEAGVASAKVPAHDTLDAAEGNESLTSVCDLMSEQAKRQTIVYARRSAGLADVDWTCEKATALLLRRAGQLGGLKRSLRAKVVGVNVKGDRATASIRFGGTGPISTVPLVKEDGKWKLAASPSGGGDR